MKCEKCGLVQSRSPQCKRCGSPLGSLDNPYAPPTVGSPSGLAAGAAGALYRDGEILVARDGAPLPDRCVRCNRPAEGFRLKRTFYWHPQGWYLLILVSIFVYAIVAIFVRKKATLEVPLCPDHRTRRRALIGAALLLPVATLVIGSVVAGDLLGIWILVALLVAIVLGILGSQLLTPKRIDEEFAYLKGAHAEFLRQLPAMS